MSLSLAMEMATWPVADQEIFLMGLTREEMAALRWDWSFWGRPEQHTPPGNWSVWLAMAGRGFGKTRLGAEWVREQVEGATPLSPGRAARVALIAETAADCRDVIVEGTGGILQNSPPDFRPTYTKSLRKLEWPNGAVAFTYSADDPEQLRGPEHDLAWSDELAKWRYAQETWDMLQFGLRLGNPRQLVTTTPRPIPIVRELLADQYDPTSNAPGGTVVTRGSTFDNAANLSPKFLGVMKKKYEGTRLGRQELHAEVLDDVPGALWTRAMLDRRTPTNPLGAGMAPGEKLPPLRRIVIGVDPSGSSGEQHEVEDAHDDIGIVACAETVGGDYIVLRDGTCNFGPADWAKRVDQMYRDPDFPADRVVGEANFGGAMVEHTIRTVNRRINFSLVNASRGKVVRAEPIAALYEQGRVRHLGLEADGGVGRGGYGPLGLLEDQMCSMTRSGYEGRGSPDRVDALVWALTELAFGVNTRGGSKAVGGAH